MAKILIVEDDAALRGMVQKWLQFEQHTVEVADNGESGLEQLKFYKYDLVILDWDLPKLSGVEVCKQFRAQGGGAAVLMLTGKSAVDEKIAGLESGADDYLTKPFNMKELSARIRALMRRPNEYKSDVLRSGDLVVDGGTMRVQRNGQEIALSQSEFKLLFFLMKHNTQVFSAEALLDRIWKSDSDASTDVIRTHIKKLRKKLDVEGQESVIRNVHGVGYCFSGNVES